MPENKVSTDLVISVIAISIFVLLLMLALIMIFRIYLKRKNKLQLEKQMMAVQFEQTLLQSQLEIQEQTFKYISGELHDNVNQVLSLVRINLNTLHTNDSDKIEKMDDLLGKAIADLRQLSHSLDAEEIRNQGWTEPVIKTLRSLEASGRYKIKCKISPDAPTIESEKGIILFRLLQEAINNIIKHSQASEINFETRNEKNSLTIELSDNGKGFELNNVTHGLGLRNLVSRAKMIDANLSLQSKPGSGTSVIIAFNSQHIE
jgi:signal transduction histidine kinase